MVCVAPACDFARMNKHPVTLQSAMMAAQDLPQTGEVPEWIHLLPTARGAIQTADQRGPFHVTNVEEIIAASFAHSDQLEVDVNHSTFTAAPRGERSDAVGWITQMQARDDGVWGKVDWNDEGRALVSSKAYRRISPIIIHDPANRIVRIANASLVNRPNFRGLAALNQETTMSLSQRLAELLGLEAAATEEQLLEAVTAKTSQSAAPAETAALQAAQPEELISLQAEVTSLGTQLQTERNARARDKAEAFVDGEILKLRAGVKPSRDRFISMHMADPAGTEEMISGFPVVAPSNTTGKPPTAKDGEIALNSEQIEVAKYLGLDPKAYAKTLQAEQEGADQ
jgi:phage I-like protein